MENAAQNYRDGKVHKRKLTEMLHVESHEKPLLAKCRYPSTTEELEEARHVTTLMLAA